MGEEFYGGGATGIRALILTVLGPAWGLYISQMGTEAGGKAGRERAPRFHGRPMGAPLYLLPLLLLTAAASTQTIFHCLSPVCIACLCLYLSPCLSRVSITYYSLFFLNPMISKYLVQGGQAHKCLLNNNKIINDRGDLYRGFLLHARLCAACA